MVCRSMLASDSGEIDNALFLLSRGVSRGLEKRDTGHRDTIEKMSANSALLHERTTCYLQIDRLLTNVYTMSDVQYQEPFRHSCHGSQLPRPEN